MRFLKRLIVSVLAFMALWLYSVLVAQAITGYDFTAAYTAGGIVGAVELALSSFIKITETREEKRLERAEIKEKNNEPRND